MPAFNSEVNKYYLFIDSESSGLPLNWHQPLSESGNWPRAVQVSWIIYNENREEVKRENFYIRDDDFEITAAATKVHGITSAFLKTNGVSRSEALSVLAADLREYQPLVIGHFIKLDYYVLSADFLRMGTTSALDNSPLFCTMVASGQLRRSVVDRQLHLEELYYLLFNRDLQQQHNALADAAATAECFFKLWDEGELGHEVLRRQSMEAQRWRDPSKTSKNGCFPVILIILIAVLIIYIAGL
ncbi:3'-5' exonuclease [Mucilaginibacter sp. RS28]|uniref:3'-5' exonuclease n=1 Tax=Mucilaginibacter straminoryzae TaxID=2932774 RepID=A0A9X1X3S8_9SPHI|nr:exonuclease domain-containing protein [Mucilaginibacter straminoryzae]MCJ8210036.1 3'-5' exonuclease [Mucilaginibacter straminoryzae]